MLTLLLNFLKGLFVEGGMELLERAAEPELVEVDHAFEEPFTEPDVDELLGDFDGMFHESEVGTTEPFAHT
jgi:hypothetical protein